MNKNPNDDEVIIDLDKSKNLKTIGKQFKQSFTWILTILIVLILLLASIYRLETGTVGVITRFGAIIGTNERAGIHLKMPFIDHVAKVDVESEHAMEYGYRTAVSGTTTSTPSYEDQNAEGLVIIQAQQNNASIILLELVVRYQIDDPINYLYKVDDLEGTMRIALEDIIRNILPTFTIDDALERKSMIDAAILPLYQEKLNQYEAGIDILQTTIQNVSLLPTVEETRQKVEESNQYKQGREEEAQKYANTVLPKANAEATRLLESAKGFSAQVIAQANADVAEFDALYSEYIQNPEVVKERYYIEAMQQVLLNNNLVIDQSSNGNFLKFFDVNESQAMKGAQ